MLSLSTLRPAGALEARDTRAVLISKHAVTRPLIRPALSATQSLLLATAAKTKTVAHHVRMKSKKLSSWVASCEFAAADHATPQ